MMIDVEPIAFHVDGGARGPLTLRGTKYLPEHFDEHGKAPVALLFHGFGGNRIDFSGFMVRLARELAARGIVAVTYDRAGHGESDGEFFDTTVTGDVSDALQVAEVVRSLPGCDPNNLHLAGLSLGAVIATWTAPRLAVQPRSIALCSIAASYADEIRGGHLQGRSLSTVDDLGYFDFMGVAMGRAMIDDATAFDPYKQARGFAGYAKFFHGTKDFIPIEYARHYRDVYGKRMDLLEIEGGDHGFGNVEHRRIVMQGVGEFIASQAM